MKIERVQINHMEHPLGFDLNGLCISGIVSVLSGDTPLERHLVIKKKGVTSYDSGWEPATHFIFFPKLRLDPRTFYEVTMQVRNQHQIVSHQSWFETGKMNEPMAAQWIGTSQKDVHSIQLTKTFHLTGSAANARLYISGLGVYECYLDGNKIGNEYLAPGFTNYNQWVQLATYDVTEQLTQTGLHKLTIVLGEGWYRGQLGIAVHGGRPNIYGDRLMAIAELHYQNDQYIEKLIRTDQSWQCSLSKITDSGIYYGEDLDAMRGTNDLLPTVLCPSPTKQLTDRIRLPITAHEKLSVAKVITTPKNETILDFGQNFAGWVTFQNDLPRGTQVRLDYGEVLQDGEFYRDNLRSARAAFTYTSDGSDQFVRPHFTYFGFRYVRLTGFPVIHAEHFRAVALYSNMRSIGTIETDNGRVNRLFKNVQWGLKSNFVDIPTDCPQRDERLGWTGDAALFAPTAELIMDTYPFFKKYARDMSIEQSSRSGMLTLYVPAADGQDGGKAVWGDAATLIPWTQYQRTCDPAILEQNFDSMTAWVDWIHTRAQSQGQEFLWNKDNQLGDWLALDTEDVLKMKGRTPDDLIATAYYYQSAQLTANAARILGRKDENECYQQLATKIKQAFQDEFFSPNGRLVVDTQTGYAVCLHLGLVPEQSINRTVADLVKRIEKDRSHLTTGFVGTPALLPALSANGQHEIACRLFLNDDYPSWLYEVKHGATTIWERWNSIESDGRINAAGMNSLNHYAYGSVMQWAYEYLLGIRQKGLDAVIQPGIDPRFAFVSGHTELPTGKISVKWQINEGQSSQVTLQVQIPYGSKATIILPRTENWQIGNQTFTNGDQLTHGNYIIHYLPDHPFVNGFDIHTPLRDWTKNADLAQQLQTIVPFWTFITDANNFADFQDFSLLQLSDDMRSIGFPELTSEQIQNINQLCGQVAPVDHKKGTWEG
ncbi:MAG: family 78 glycoside hydrolase catalytic domain [Sporolactobacillus sp.]